LKHKKYLFFSLFIITFILLLSKTAIASSDYQALLKGLNSKYLNDRLYALQSLGSAKDERAVDALIDLLDNKYEDWEIQSKAIRLLGESKNPKSINILLEYLDNVFLNYECPAIKWNTAIALGNFKNNTRVFEALLNNLYYDNLQVREAVVQSLGAIGNKDAVPYLIPVLKEDSFALKYSAIKALYNIGDSRAIPYLKKFIALEKEAILKKEAMNVIKKIDPKI